MEKLYDRFASWKLVKSVRRVKLFDKLLSYEILTYLIFGALTTAVNFVVFFLADKLFGAKHLADIPLFGHTFSVTMEDVSTIIAWLAAVLFAFVTNKLWVFESRGKRFSVVVKELLRFVGARILSFVLFESLGFMLVRNVLLICGAGEKPAKWIGKILISILVIIFNYVASKFVVFRRARKQKDGEDA